MQLIRAGMSLLSTTVPRTRLRLRLPLDISRITLHRAADPRYLHELML